VRPPELQSSAWRPSVSRAHSLSSRSRVSKTAAAGTVVLEFRIVPVTFDFRPMGKLQVKGFTASSSEIRASARMAATGRASPCTSTGRGCSGGREEEALKAAAQLE
jgi:hypothetical protein